MDVVARNNVITRGEGARPVVLVHGFGTDQTMWRGVVEALAPDHRVVLLDHVGSGRSDIASYSPGKYGNLDAYANDLAEICAALDLRDALLVGHSIGGMIALRAAIAAPDRFRGLVMIGSSARYLDDPPSYTGGFTAEAVDGLLDMMERNYLGWAKALAPRVMKSPDRPDLENELEALFCATDPAIARRFAAVTFYSDSRALLADARLPTLLLQSPDDMIVPRAAADYLAAKLPSATLRVLQAVGHYPHLRDPIETARLIGQFLVDAPDA
jgi:sigma-B regulation protein RsbQ